MGALYALAVLLTAVPLDGGAAQLPRATLEAQMARNPKDESKEPPGGRALERLRQFENARRPAVTPDAEKAKPAPDEADRAPPKERGGRHEGEDR